MLAEMLKDADRIRRLEVRLSEARLASQRQLIERQHLQETIRDLLQRFAVSTREQPGPFPPELARQLGDAFDATLAGYVHPLLRPAPKRPGQRTWPALRKAQVNALVYIELVKRGMIADRHPVKTVSEMFQVSRRLLRYWRRELQPEALKAIRKVSSEEILYLRATLSNEARRYRRWRGKGEAVPPQDARPALRGMSSSRVLL